MIVRIVIVIFFTYFRVCQENCILVSTLEEKSLELKKIHAEKMGNMLLQ